MELRLAEREITRPAMQDCQQPQENNHEIIDMQDTRRYCFGQRSGRMQWHDQTRISHAMDGSPSIRFGLISAYCPRWLKLTGVDACTVRNRGHA